VVVYASDFNQAKERAMDWAQEEFESLELGDVRLKRRAVQLV
jgi:hypothetical protein